MIFPACMFNFGKRKGQVWLDNSPGVQIDEKNSEDAVCRLGTTMQRIFCAQSGVSIRMTFWKWARVSTQGLGFCPFLKTFVAHFRSNQLTALRSLRMSQEQFIGNKDYKQ